MTPYLISAALAAGLAIGGYTGWTFNQARHDAATVASKKASADALKAAAEAIATRDVKHTTITQKVIRETVEKPVYRDCVHDASSMRNINAALSVSADPGELPASDASR